MERQEGFYHTEFIKIVFYENLFSFKFDYSLELDMITIDRPTGIGTLFFVIYKLCILISLDHQKWVRIRLECICIVFGRIYNYSMLPLRH